MSQLPWAGRFSHANEYLCTSARRSHEALKHGEVVQGRRAKGE
jgi:hypothetical protein